MNEVAFRDHYREKWTTLEEQLQDTAKLDPDELAERYIQLSDDLAYARTYFPESKTEHYLNHLSVKAYNQLLVKTKYEPQNFLSFWSRQLPEVFYRNRPYFYYSFIFFFLTCAVGTLSTLYDEEFPRLILGDAYIEMTLNNIEEGDPFGVYKDEHMLYMFLRIFFNNFMVAFRAFALGLLSILGTGLIMTHNGIMLGTFMTFFFTKGLLTDSILTVFIHGTLEISAIIIGGAAGFRLGSSFLFPGTYSRAQAFKRAAQDGIRITTGLIPVFLVAALLESYVTRLTGMPNFLKLLILLVSAAFVLWYFFLLPQKRHG